MKGFTSAKDILLGVDILQTSESKDNYVTTEFQDFGLRLASTLSDYQHKSLYIMYAQKVPRALIESALQFTLDYPSASNRAKIFMWKLREICKSKSIGLPRNMTSRKVPTKGRAGIIHKEDVQLGLFA